MTLDLPNQASFRPKARKHPAFWLHVGCALLGAFCSIRTSSSSGQDFKPTLQAGRPAAYTPPGVPLSPHPLPILKARDLNAVNCCFLGNKYAILKPYGLYELLKDKLRCYDE